MGISRRSGDFLGCCELDVTKLRVLWGTWMAKLDIRIITLSVCVHILLEKSCVAMFLWNAWVAKRHTWLVNLSVYVRFWLKSA